MRKLVCILGMILSLLLMVPGGAAIYAGVTMGDELQDELQDMELLTLLPGEAVKELAPAEDASVEALLPAAALLLGYGVVGVMACGGLMLTGISGLLVSLYGFFAAGASNKRQKWLRKIAEGSNGGQQEQLKGLISELMNGSARQQELLLQLINDQKNSSARQQELLLQLVNDQKNSGAQQQKLLQSLLSSQGESAEEQQKLLLQMVNDQNTGNAAQQLLLRRIAEKEMTAPAAATQQTAQPTRASGPADATWVCSLCGHENSGRQTSCEMCRSDRVQKRPELQKPATGGAGAPASGQGEWICQTCGMQNAAGTMECAICGERRR